MQILIYPLRSKANKKGEAPLMIRVTVGPGDKAEINTGKGVDPKLWDGGKKRMTGKSVQADILNKYLVHCENKLNRIENELVSNEKPYTAEIIRNIYQGNHIERFTLLQILDLHNVQFNEKKGQEGFSAGRYGKYLGLKSKLAYFMQLKYNRKDMFITELKFEFVEDFWHFLTTVGKEVKGKFVGPMDPETAAGKITMLKKIGKMGFRKQGIYINPFDDFKIPPFTKEKKQPLTMNEVDTLRTKTLKIERLARVRDRVIVGCFTGMANIEIQNCTRDRITIDIQGKKWLDVSREKTDELCLIPLWEPVLEIIEKYKDDPELAASNRLFPQISLQKMNAYLQELADLCEITKPMTTHVFRHTFATIYINSGGTYENLARILGHSDVRTSKLYGDRDMTTMRKEVNEVWENLDRMMKQAAV